MRDSPPPQIVLFGRTGFPCRAAIAVLNGEKQDVFLSISAGLTGSTMSLTAAGQPTGRRNNAPGVRIAPQVPETEASGFQLPRILRVFETPAVEPLALH